MDANPLEYLEVSKQPDTPPTASPAASATPVLFVPDTQQARAFSLRDFVKSFALWELFKG